MIFDPFKVPKIARPATLTPIATNVDDIRRLAGVGVYDKTIHNNTSVQADLSAQRRQIERERNIQPGTDAWFRLWFAKTDLTGERPWDESQ